jgi:hypothetical protein
VPEFTFLPFVIYNSIKCNLQLCQL